MRESGFTLIEVLVAATIIGLLSTIGYGGFQAITRSGRDALRKTDLEQIRSALEIYKSENGSYPIADPSCSAATALVPSYLKTYPSDPKSPLYRYCYIRDTNLTYRLCNHLENGSLADNCGGSKLCGNGDGTDDNCNYQLANP